MQRTLYYKDDYVLENNRVRLSKLSHHHISELLLCSRDERIWTYFIDKGISDIEAYCTEAIQNNTLCREYPFVIYDKKCGEYAGMTRLYNYSKTLGHIKIGHTWIDYKHWRSGLNTNCKYLLFEFVFDYLGLERVGFGVHESNDRSIRSLSSMGCLIEGRLRSFIPEIGSHERKDVILFSLLKMEWLNSTKNYLNRRMLSVPHELKTT